MLKNFKNRGQGILKDLSFGGFGNRMFATKPQCRIALQKNVRTKYARIACGFVLQSFSRNIQKELEIG